MLRNLSQNNFRNEVLKGYALNIVQFTCEYNGASQILAPVYEELARQYKGEAHFFITDSEPHSFLEKEFGILELPAILFFKAGVLIDHSVGLISKNKLIAKIENALAFETTNK